MCCLLEAEWSSWEVFPAHHVSLGEFNSSLGLDQDIATRTLCKILQLAPVQPEPSHFPVLKDNCCTWEIQKPFKRDHLTLWYCLSN